LFAARHPENLSRVPGSPDNFISEQPASQARVIFNVIVGMKFRETCDILTENSPPGEK
jgi:hypothetical protein